MAEYFVVSFLTVIGSFLLSVFATPWAVFQQGLQTFVELFVRNTCAGTEGFGQFCR